MTIPSDKTLRLERTKLTPQPPRGRNTTLIMALIAGVAAAALAYVFLSHQQPAPQQPVVVAPQEQAVVVAAQDIPARQIVKPEMVQLANVPTAKVTPGAVTTLSGVDGYLSVNPIAKGAQILTTDVQAKNPIYGIAMAVPKGMRAVTIALDPVSSVAGFVKPGDFVDVLCTFQGHGQSLTRTVLQNVPLLATGAQVLATAPPPPTPEATSNNNNANGQPQGNAANPNGDTAPKPIEVPNATVIVTPEDAEKLIMATQKGRLQLALRSTGDATVNPIPAVHESVVTTVAPEGGAAAAVKTVVKVVRVPVFPPASNKLPMVMPTPPSPITVIRGAAVSTMSATP